MFLVLGTAAALVVLFPFGVIGMIALETVRNSLRGSLDSPGLFAQGVTAGFLLLDAAVLASLNGLEVLHTAPPLSLAILVALQLIVFLRLLVPNERLAVAEASPVFRQKLVAYWSSSQLELIATCVMMPSAYSPRSWARTVDAANEPYPRISSWRVSAAGVARCTTQAKIS